MNKYKIIAGLAIGSGIFALAPEAVRDDRAEPFQNRYFAHRGLYTKEQNPPENSISAFSAAVKMGYGVELDVQFSKDEEIVVFHDESLKRVCGVDGSACDYTLSELREMRLFKSQETIPTLEEVLSIIAGKVPIIVEFKSGRENKKLCEKTTAILYNYDKNYSKHNYDAVEVEVVAKKEESGISDGISLIKKPGNISACGETVSLPKNLKNWKSELFCVESFDPRIVMWFKHHAPGLYRGQLANQTNTYDDKLPWIVRFFNSHCLWNFGGRPQFIAYGLGYGKKPWTVKLVEKMGAKKVAWTSHNPSDKENNDSVIFEYYRPPISW